MKTSYVAEGVLLDIVAGSDLDAGDIMFVGATCGQVVTDLVNGQLGALRVEGVISVAKESATVFAPGSAVHWDADNSRASEVPDDGFMGVAVGGGTNGATYVLVKLNSPAAGGGGVLIAAPQTMTAAGAVSVATYYTSVDTTTGSGHASTLADGAFAGQLKKVQLIVDGGDLVLTPANLSGGTTITFADVGDFAILAWSGSDWVAVELGNDADGATAPAIA